MAAVQEWVLAGFCTIRIPRILCFWGFFSFFFNPLFFGECGRLLANGCGLALVEGLVLTVCSPAGYRVDSVPFDFDIRLFYPFSIPPRSRVSSVMAPSTPAPTHAAAGWAFPSHIPKAVRMIYAAADAASLPARMRSGADQCTVCVSSFGATGLVRCFDPTGMFLDPCRDRV